MTVRLCAKHPTISSARRDDQSSRRVCVSWGVKQARHCKTSSEKAHLDRVVDWYLRPGPRTTPTEHRHTAPRLERLAHRHPAVWACGETCAEAASSGELRRAQASSDELRRAQRPPGAPPFILASRSAISGKTGWSSSPSRKRCSPGWGWVEVGSGLGWGWGHY